MTDEQIHTITMAALTLRTVWMLIQTKRGDLIDGDVVKGIMTDLEALIENENPE